ncbi:glycine--tRNA ligase subunit beta [Streptomyces sp. NPDC051738]|uniref:glycine--tRNA ligase subunit beta n=1 Tax=Streptomyces sp. NPDC051738 TaxID=3365672 RepID=UPI0037D0D110
MERAATLTKFDLGSRRVTEPSSLAGVMAREYASRAGQSEALAQALFESELPRAADDALPTTLPGAPAALADRPLGIQVVLVAERLVDRGPVVMRLPPEWSRHEPPRQEARRGTGERDQAECRHAVATTGHSRSSSCQPLPGPVRRPAQAEFGLGVRGRLGHLQTVSTRLTTSRGACQGQSPWVGGRKGDSIQANRGKCDLICNGSITRPPFK